MTPSTRNMLAGLSLALLAGSGSAQSQHDPLAPLAPDPVVQDDPPPATVQRAPWRATTPAPAALRERITSLGRSFDGLAGISVLSTRDGWQIDQNAARLYPQQSCSKLWVAITALDLVDQGRVKLDDRVTLGRDDLTLFHQPNPKPNGYQSLHTTVVTGDAGIVEMQVRTKDMHQRAQFGIASHMSYKSLAKGAGKNAFQRLSFPWIRDLVPALLNMKRPVATNQKASLAAGDVPRWLTDLKEAHSEVESDEFVEGLKSDFFSHRIFVFTPIGDVIDLPTESTPIDFAYAIHSDLGDHLQGAKVNGKLVSFDTKLRNGDIIEILKSKSAHPTAKWMDYARTSMARRHIRATLDAGERARPHAESAKPKKDKRTKKAK